MGRGAVYLMISSVVLLLSGYAIHFVLGRKLGPEDYGTFGVVFALMNTIGLVLASGLPDATSKYIAEDDAALQHIVRNSRRIQAILSTVLFALYFGLAGVIANLLDDPELAVYIRISAFVIPAYAFYYVYYSYLNGLRLFGKQARTLAAVSIARVGIVFALVFLGLSVKGAILGYILAALVGLALAWKYLGDTGEGSRDFEWRKLIKFGIPATLFAVMLFIVMNADLLLVKALIDEGVDAGYYTAAATIAKAPYFLFMGLALALLPSISSSTSRNDSQVTAAYINQSMRYMLMLLVPGILLISATSGDLVSLVYSARYVEAGDPLSVLIFGLASLSVFLVLTHVIMGAGKPNIALGVAMFLVIVDIALNVVLIPRYDLMGAAWATTIASLAGMSIAAIYVFRRFKALIAVKSFVRICLASLVVYAIALQFSLSPSFLPLVYVGLFAVYLGLLVLMRELNKEDVAALKRIIPSTRSGE